MKPVILALFLLSGVANVAAAESVVVTAPTVVYDMSDPKFCRNCRSFKLIEVTEGKRLALLDGASSSEVFVNYLDGAPEEVALAKVVSGGALRLAYSPAQARLVATVTYGARRVLTQRELVTLAEYTRGQLLDGIGENFTQTANKQRLWVEFDVLEKRNISAVQAAP